MKIIALQGAAIASGSYRIGYPMTAMHRRGHEVEIRTVEMRMRVSNAMLVSDILLLQGACDTGWIDLVHTIPEEYRPRVVYETDDLITNLETNNPSYRLYTHDKLLYGDNAGVSNRAGIIQCMRRSDAIICTTEYLANEYRSFLPNIPVYVCPNHIDFGIRNWDAPEKRTDDRLTIGWAGSAHHFGDEEPIREAIPAILKSHPEVSFAICSHPDLAKQWRNSIGINESQFRIIPGRDFEEYPGVLSQFDIGIAPLADTRFNRCKSDLKLLEYGAWGIPCVASGIEPYSKLARSVGYDRILLASSTEEWFSELNYLIYTSTRKEIGKILGHYVRTNRGLERAGECWESAFTEILSLPRNPYQPKGPLSKIGRNEQCACGSGLKHKNCCAICFR